MTPDQLQGLAEAILVIAIVALVGYLEYRHDQKKRSHK